MCLTLHKGTIPGIGSLERFIYSVALWIFFLVVRLMAPRYLKDQLLENSWEAMFVRLSKNIVTRVLSPS